MRFVPINCLAEGMIVGKRLFGKNGELLLNSGTIMKSSYIDRISELGYGGIYVDDPMSEGIEIAEVISDELRIQTVRTIKDSFVKMEKGLTDSADETLDSITALLDQIIEEVAGNTDMLVNMVDMKIFDDYTYYHSVNVAVLSLVIGVSMGLNRSRLYRLGLAAILHDIGKIFIPKDILNKPAKLTDQEFEIMKTHSEKGYKYLKVKFNIPSISYNSVLHHHERYDGTGYPEGLAGEKIAPYARIIAASDVYDALTSRRPYRKALAPSEAIEYLMGGGGSLFDIHVTECFIKKIAPYPTGSCVRLSNNAMGIVMKNYKDSSLRPKLRIVKENGMEITPYVLDLRNDKHSLDITILGPDEGMDIKPVKPAFM